MTITEALELENSMWRVTKNSDLAGTFHITTTWSCTDEGWKVVFNMDQRVL
ncbi:MAG: hypothetical protein ACI4KR_02260 [Ruminiclostridium sp.]